MDKYFVINNSAGDTSIQVYEKEQLLKAISPDKDGLTDYGHDLEFIDKVNLTKNSDTNYWGAAILIIKGSIVIPKVKEVIKNIDIE